LSVIQIDEFLEEGCISEARKFLHSIRPSHAASYIGTETALKSPRFQALREFTQVYGIGPSTARQLYALGLRTIEHLERYYGVEPFVPTASPSAKDSVEVKEEINESDDIDHRYPSSAIMKQDSGLTGDENIRSNDIPDPPSNVPVKQERGVILDSEYDAKDVMHENWIRIALGLRQDLATKSARFSLMLQTPV